MANDGPNRNEALAKLWSMIKDIKVAMMTSWDGQHLHSRPMHGHQKEFEGKLYFFTRRHSGKTDEIGRFDQVNLAYADPDEQNYVSLAGKARITTDRVLMQGLWNPMASAWFPKGLDDPDLALIEVEAESAQYWDSTDSTMRYLWQVATANLTGREPDMGENAKVELKPRAEGGAARGA
jgi:general stress protein 26